MQLVDPATMAEQIVQHHARHADRLQQHREMLAEHLPAGPPAAVAVLGRYLALMAGVSYERAWVEWADVALPVLDAQARNDAPDRSP